MNDCQCGAPSTEVIVTVNEWIIECCHDCAVKACDHLASTEPAR